MPGARSTALVRAASALAASALALLAASLPGQAHAESDQVPAWIGGIFAYYVEGKISDAELIDAIEFLIGAGVIDVDAAPAAAGGGPQHQAGGSKIPDRGDFFVRYWPNPDSAYGDGWTRDWLESTGLMEWEAGFLNENFRLPHDVGIAGRECGEPNAFYDPSAREITVCYEYVDYLFELWDEYGDDPEYAHTYVEDVVHETFYHEVGHAIIDVYDLPITGLEENVADQFSALMLSYTYDDSVGHALGQEMLFNIALNHLHSSIDMMGYEYAYWDTHGIDEQRHYNFLCYAYGADPEYNQDLIDLEWLPEERANSCEREYERIERGWSHLLRDYTNGFFG